MGDKSKIEWTDATWNPVTGCTKISPGCKNCYAERMYKRFGDKWGYGFEKIALHYNRLDQPKHWRKPRRIFVCSMSDLFHHDVPDSFIGCVIDTMRATPQHIYQVLTKRAGMLVFDWCWPDNCWVGISAENQNTYDRRTRRLYLCDAKHIFLSLEPLLEPIDLMFDLGNNRRPGWVIVGGESGPGARFMNDDWVRDIRDQCVEYKIPFFFKQRSGKKQKGLPELDGKVWDQIPKR